jgi:hypothetical protein
MSFDESVEEFEHLPDVFMYLMDGDEPICFRRDSVTNFAENNF